MRCGTLSTSLGQSLPSIRYGKMPYLEARKAETVTTARAEARG